MDNPIEKTPEAEPLTIRVTDRRGRREVGAQAISTPPDPSRRLPTVMAELEERLKRTESKLADALELLRRRETEAEGFQLRVRREMERRTRAEREGFLKELLEIADSLDRGLAAAEEAGSQELQVGLSRIRGQFLAVLARQGVEPMELLGTTYDPHIAEAVSLSPLGDGEQEGRIVEEIRRGYRIDAQVLRPAQVRVCMNSSLEPPEAEGNGNLAQDP